MDGKCVVKISFDNLNLLYSCDRIIYIEIYAEISSLLEK